MTFCVNLVSCIHLLLTITHQLQMPEALKALICNSTKHQDQIGPVCSTLPLCDIMVLSLSISRSDPFTGPMRLLPVFDVECIGLCAEHSVVFGESQKKLMLSKRIEPKTFSEATSTMSQLAMGLGLMYILWRGCWKKRNWSVALKFH